MTLTSKIKDILLNRYKKINIELEETIKSNIDPSDDKLLIAIKIYLSLGKYLRYNSNFSIFYDYRLTSKYYNVTPENNQVICDEWSIIFKKLLNDYGIEADLCCDGLHYYVRFIVDGVEYDADATKYGLGTNNIYYLSDISNIKFNFGIKNIKIRNSTSDKEEKLERTKQQAYKSLNMKIISKEKEERIIELLTKKINKKKDKLSLEALLDYRISLINFFMKFKIEKSTLENSQLLLKYYVELFRDLNPDDYTITPLYYLMDKEIKIYHLISVTINQNTYYYLELNGQFKKMTKEELKETLYKYKLHIKSYTPVKGFNEGEALGFRI